MLKKMPVIMQKSMSYMQELMGDLIPEMAEITDELEKKYKKK
jgi:hypothetical protein